MNGPGRYDDLCTTVRESTSAEGVVLVVFNGQLGSGFSIQGPDGFLMILPSVFRQMADQVEQDTASLVKSEPKVTFDDFQWLKVSPVLPGMEEKTLDVTSSKTQASDVKMVGNVDRWVLLCKASSQTQGWMKSTKAMEVPGGCLVQVTTQQRNPDGSSAVAEAVSFVPNVIICGDVGDGHKLDLPSSG